MNIEAKIEGLKPDKYIHAINLGSGFANYAKVNGAWYSVNGGVPVITDVRWVCSKSEACKIEAYLKEDNGESVIDDNIGDYENVENLWWKTFDSK